MLKYNPAWSVPMIIVQTIVPESTGCNAAHDNEETSNFMFDNCHLLAVTFNVFKQSSLHDSQLKHKTFGAFDACITLHHTFGLLPFSWFHIGKISHLMALQPDCKSQTIGRRVRFEKMVIAQK